MRKPDIALSAMLVALVMGGLLMPGYIFAFDMSWGPQYPYSDSSSNTFLLHQLIRLLDMVLPMWLVQKLILATIIVLSFVGMRRLLGAIRTTSASVDLPYLGGLVYVCNAFFYTRFVNGQWLVLLGYALLPWALYALWKYLRRPTWRQAVVTGLWAGVIGLVSIHTIGIYLLLATVVALVYGWKTRHRWWRSVAIIPLIWLILNIWWLLPTLSGASPTALAIDAIGDSQLEAFATSGTVLGNVPLSTLLLHGFWAESQDRYVVLSDVPIWWVAEVIMTGLVLAGTIQIIRYRDRLGIALLISGVIGWYLSMGIAWSGSEAVTRWLIEYLPLYSGYREPQKWLMLLVLLYVYASTWALKWLLGALSQRWQRSVLIVVSVLMALLWAPWLLLGTGGQLRAADYPRGWYEMQAELDRRGVSGPVVVFPWHMYQYVDFAGRTVPNPARYFFTQPVVTGTNVELGGVADQARSQLDRVVGDQIMPNESVITSTGSLLAPYGVCYAMLMKDADWHDYEWLDRQTDLRAVYDNDAWRLYQVQGTGCAAR